MDGRIETVASARVLSLRQLRRRYPSESACREFLERLRWPEGPRCPRCVHDRYWRLEGQKCRPGLRQCQSCRYQYTVTTGTPMHASKLPLWIWLQALYLVVTSSKGISSVVMSRILGVTQSTAWRLGHSVREMMHDRDGKGPPLKGIVELDIKYLGGKPKRRKEGEPNRQGKATSKTKVLITTERDGPAKGAVITSESSDDIEAALAGTVEQGTRFMSDNQTAFGKALRALGGTHETVKHSAGEFVRDDVHSSTADGLGSLLERAKFGVWHKFSRQHVQRYVDEITFRWSNRVRTTIKTKKGKKRRIVKLVPVEQQFKSLIQAGIGRRLQRTPKYGFRAFTTAIPCMA